MWVIALWLSGIAISNAQATVFGIVRDLDSREPVEFASVHIRGAATATETDKFGEYNIQVEAGIPLTLVISRLGYTETEVNLDALPVAGKRNINIDLARLVSDVGLVIRSSRIEDVGMVTEEVTELKKLPTASGNFESILPHIALGTSGGTGGELSAQYNVRGGNYDENLVYVNDFEIFRPQLIRSSQQEGLSFPNIDLIRDISFSSGGFESRYGDKMSSVLDIRYKRPDRFGGSASASFLGASAHVEGSKRLGRNAWNKFRYLVGARYKTTRYLLGSLDVTGEYAPDFSDIQSWMTYDISRSIQAGVLLNYNRARYEFVPRERVSASGLFTQVLQLTTLFEGREVDEFENAMGGLSLTFIPEKEKNPFFLKLLASVYGNYESEKFDLLGFYRLSQVEFDLEGEGSVNEVAVLGTGTQHIYARNRLESSIANVQLKGAYEMQVSDRTNHFIQFGLKYQEESIDDRLSEWERLDSAGYSLPFNEEEVLLNNFIRSENDIRSYRLQGYVQNSINITGAASEFRITGGVRTQYWSFNDEWVVSPRGQLFVRPLNWNRDITFKLAGGLYYQLPFYRELRMPSGQINPNIQGQKSLHLVAGLSYDFPWKGISDKKFRLISEIYYKKLDRLISYEIDNVRIRYSGINDSEGYVAGLDLRINGEFVPGAESWLNLSLLQARERIIGVDHLRFVQGDTIPAVVDFVPRPTDRFFNLSLFFQDYLPSNEDFRMSLNLTFGSGLPFGQKDNNIVYRNTFRFKNYQRVDIGFTYVLWNEGKRAARPLHPLRFTRSASLGLEVYNLLQIANVGSNLWIKTIGEQQYAIPNFLTSRRINLRIMLDF